MLSIALFTFIFLVGNLVKLADLLVNKGVNFLDIIKILILMLPQIIIFVLPTSALASVLLVFGGFAQNNEITAMKASGINVLKVMLPIMLIASLMSVVVLLFVDQVQPRVRHMYRSMIRDLVVQRPDAYIEAGRFVKVFQGYIIRVQEVEGKQLKGVTIFQPEEGKPTRTIMAERGELVTSPDQKTLSIKLYNGISDEPSPDNPDVLYKLNFDTFELPSMSLSDNPNHQTKRKLKDMSLNELIHILRTMQEYRHNLEIKGWQQSDVQKDVTSLTLECKAEVQSKIAFSFATFSFVLVGLPLAIITRRGEAIVSFVLSMLAVAGYYVLTIAGRSLAIKGVMPAFAALWFPNFILVGLAVFFMFKVIRL
ncbi:MAG: hypothetical protein COV74_06380 [Candidatus Omnitrophica bacterium CG11_big_fil_rev_8_21_14_0_20_45_26]|uniref:YjgP/YjgQ family permease n=1 Tax=Candidatus Abzuiibacterium crystallinum TaxID=1974748 RepID=A0A2H0LRE6_9BACT|nr:MAG: hypothetical protein COV74_06380 [Candidatus Omnitrophica bacterium CG11_big_fil_rev_8_21_14_0_20_45_26]